MYAYIHPGLTIERLKDLTQIPQVVPRPQKVLALLEVPQPAAPPQEIQVLQRPVSQEVAGFAATPGAGKYNPPGPTSELRHAAAA